MSRASKFLEVVSARPTFRGPTFHAELSDGGWIAFVDPSGNRLPMLMSEETARKFALWLSDLYSEDAEGEP